MRYAALLGLLLVMVSPCFGQGADADAALSAEAIVAAEAHASGTHDRHHAHAAQPVASWRSRWDVFTNFGQYLPRTHCMINAAGGTDWPWVIALLLLTAGVVISYTRIFTIWRRCHIAEEKRDRNNSLMTLAYIFLWCAICGYLFTMVSFIWPGYRLLALMLVILNIFAWRFALNSNEFQASFTAKRLQRQLNEALKNRNAELESMVAQRTAQIEKANAHAAASEVRFHTLVSHIPGAVYRCRLDADWTTQFISDPIEAISGYPASDFIDNRVRPFVSIIHPEDRARVDQEIRRAVADRRGYAFEYRIQRRDGQLRWVFESGQGVFDQNTGVCLHLDGMVFDVTDRKEAETLLREAAETDRLTGLANRTVLHRRLQAEIERCRVEDGRRYALLFLDIDRFKLINDGLGHAAGDRLLVDVARRIEAVCSDTPSHRCEQSLVSRLGGDEFVVLLEGLADDEAAASVAGQLHQCLADPVEVGGHRSCVSVSMGIRIGDGTARDAAEIIRDADIAMYSAKADGRDCCAYFDAHMHKRISRRLRLESDLRVALDRQELRLVFQPIVSLESGRLGGFEALLRWDHPEDGLVSPGEFIPIAEETGLIVPIGEWVAEQACRQIVAWQRQFPSPRPLTMSINLSRRQISEPALVDRMRQILDRCGVDPLTIHLEVTEGLIMANVEQATDLLGQLKALGVQLDMDDFGTGHSSLSCLHRFPLDVLKIDRAFVQNMANRPDYAAVIHAIVSLAHNLDIRVTAEGIETTDQLAQLQGLECDNGQGYYFGKPMTATDATRFIRLHFDSMGRSPAHNPTMESP